VDTPESRALYGVYRQMADTLAPKVFFGGRLGEFKYYDMDQAVASALNLAETIKKL
jgi:UDP-galactopyranose mutase